MEYLHLFKTKSEHDSIYNGNKYKEPWSAYIIENALVTHNKDYSKNYLTVEILSDGNVTITIPANVNSSHATSISYSKDGSNWTETLVDDTAQTITISVVAGDNVYLKGIAKQWGSNWSTYTKINSTSNINVSGNAMSLLYGDVFVDKTSFQSGSQCTLCGLFKNNTHLINAGHLKLPATTSTDYCYLDMFNDCTSLTIAPELPAKTLAYSCYGRMFYGCKSLTSAPELHATILADRCYMFMFQNCTSLTSAPALPATTLANQCYYDMFCGCTSLTTAPELPATVLTQECYSQMFIGCTSLTIAPELPAKTLADSCYYRMFLGCTSLTTAPVLPATTLVNKCYSRMFNDCTSLNYIKAMFTTAPSDSYTGYWVKNVASTGTFVKNSAATWNVTGVNGIPTGWTVQTASA